jgi:hypothetical protein
VQNFVGLVHENTHTSQLGVRPRGAAARDVCVGVARALPTCSIGMFVFFILQGGGGRGREGGRRRGRVGGGW